ASPYTLSLHDALPILAAGLDVAANLAEKDPDEAHRQAVQHAAGGHEADADESKENQRAVLDRAEQQRDITQDRSEPRQYNDRDRSEEHTSELQSQSNL